MRPAQYIPENLSVYNALDLMRRTGGRYGLVTDEFGSIEGIVTLKDIIKALLGLDARSGRGTGNRHTRGRQPADRRPTVVLRFSAHFDMEDLYNDYNYNTLSGLILEKLEHIPHTGEKLSWRNFDFEIVDMDGARIDKVLVTLKRLEEADV